MKDFKIHSQHRGNLSSIKSVEDTYSDKSYLLALFARLQCLTIDSFFCLEASRPNYALPDLEGQLKMIPVNKETDFKMTKFELFFCHKKIPTELFELLPEIWFAYEHVALLFFYEGRPDFEIKRKPWYDTTSKSKSYVLFKGIEEDVIWIGKNPELVFDFEKV
jgi:hypothetical protein